MVQISLPLLNVLWAFQTLVSKKPQFYLNLTDINKAKKQLLAAEKIINQSLHTHTLGCVFTTIFKSKKESSCS